MNVSIKYLIHSTYELDRIEVDENNAFTYRIEVLEILNKSRYIPRLLRADFFRLKDSFEECNDAYSDEFIFVEDHEVPLGGLEENCPEALLEKVLSAVTLHLKQVAGKV